MTAGAGHSEIGRQMMQARLGTEDNDDARESDESELISQVGDIVKLGQVMHFFTDKKYAKVGGQQLTAVCYFCKKAVTSTGSTRLVDHLLVGCACAPKAVVEPFSKLRALCGSKKSEKRQLEAFALEEAELSKREHILKQKSLRQMGIRAGLKTSEAAAADQAIANFFYANGLSFAAADSSPDSYYHTMISSLAKTHEGYIPPCAKKIAGPLLDECHAAMWRKIRERDPDGALADKFGSTYVSDGWDSVDSLPLINSAFITANDGGLYWRSVDTSGHTKDAEYCAALMIADIYAFGCTKVVLICTDTCNTMRKCWSICMDEFPWISILPCQPHVVSLLLKDIGKAPEVQEVIKQESLIVSWFSNHQKPLAILREQCRAKFGKTKELIRAGTTRMGTNTLVGERLEEIKQPLQMSVVSEAYVAQNYKDLPDEEELGNCEKIIRQHKGGTAKKLILDDVPEIGFWARVREHVAITMPVMKLLRRHDSSAPTIGKVYSGWFELGEHLKTSTASYKAMATTKFDERWAYGHSEFAAAAYVVDPEYRDHEQSKEEEVMEGFMNTVERIGILLEVRRREQEFMVDWEKRCALVTSDPLKQKSLDHYPSYPKSEDKEIQAFAVKVNSQLVMYRTRKGVFARPWVMTAAEEMPAYIWWEQYGASVPELQQFACLVLSHPASASICERINGEFAFVKDRRRNRLAHEKANKLVALFHNLRLLKRMQKPNYVEPAVGWNSDDLKSGITKFGATRV